MITIYHNSRCSKSREGIAFLENAKVDFQIINYLDNVPTKEELQELLRKLNLPAIDLIRKKEAIWIEQYKGKDLSEDELIEAMIQNPKLIERPIIVNGSKAVIGRPTEKIKEIL
ncbi:arsenate reductase (glutaredoxin) [Flavobacterium luminosum]|uniref:Arsenate reductase (Glutaredoxin) n=1 Tax=Flavobacterium luminosum TaxID=2949086 RepID=A0ABT0TR03_9FLAO|nr:arsenate reductase (glutaredoxin) [Flavobacterium sp. HXWNR70]MCL9809701.1 arsenate reductase (glutaredoxin) [Flavobacterium sp. HXWNR70]